MIINDTDHYLALGRSDPLWAWKSFLRGHHPILMDYGIIAGVNPSASSAVSPGLPTYESYEAVRYAMGDTLHYAQKMNLIQMKPRGDLSSFGYVLANPGEEYLILQPSDSADLFSVTLDKGTYTVEWFNVNSRETMSVDQVTVGRKGKTNFTSPFAEAGPVVLYLKRV